MRTRSIPAVEGAFRAKASTRMSPNSRCAAVIGMCTSLSRSAPSEEPTLAKTPITRKRTPPTDTVRPSGSAPSNRRLARPLPMTATRRRVSTSDSRRYCPRATGRTNTSGTAGFVPLTVANALLLPNRMVSPLVSVTATRPGVPSARPMRSASPSSSRLLVGALPNSSLPGTTMTRLAPRPLTWSSTSCLAPVPIATSTTTAATPMTTPSMVSRLRSWLARSAVTATRHASANLTRSPAPGPPLWSPQQHSAVDSPKPGRARAGRRAPGSGGAPGPRPPDHG